MVPVVPVVPVVVPVVVSSVVPVVSVLMSVVVVSVVVSELPEQEVNAVAATNAAAANTFKNDFFIVLTGNS